MHVLTSSACHEHKESRKITALFERRTRGFLKKLLFRNEATAFNHRAEAIDRSRFKLKPEIVQQREDFLERMLRLMRVQHLIAEPRSRVCFILRWIAAAAQPAEFRV